MTLQDSWNDLQFEMEEVQRNHKYRERKGRKEQQQQKLLLIQLQGSQAQIKRMTASGVTVSPNG